MTLPSPSKEFGQHFLVDDNILGVIGRLADLQPDDIVLEIGPGPGGLTAYLADRVATMYAGRVVDLIVQRIVDAMHQP
jgi:16S rRNA (adenine1518-N6/adenine1519-N6)-dimethyltransferase